MDNKEQLNFYQASNMWRSVHGWELSVIRSLKLHSRRGLLECWEELTGLLVCTVDVLLSWNRLIIAEENDFYVWELCCWVQIALQTVVFINNQPFITLRFYCTSKNYNNWFFMMGFIVETIQIWIASFQQ